MVLTFGVRDMKKVFGIDVIPREFKKNFPHWDEVKDKLIMIDDPFGGVRVVGKVVEPDVTICESDVVALIEQATSQHDGEFAFSSRKCGYYKVYLEN